MSAPPLRGCTGVLFCYHDVETRVRQGGGSIKMRTRRLLRIALAGIIGSSGGVAVAPGQPTAKPAIVNPAIVKPTETRPSDPPPIAFFVATGDADACGSGCEAWIAADGKIDLDAAQRLRKLLAKLARRRLPICLHSGGGSVLGAIELGRLMRSRNISGTVARTVPPDLRRHSVP